MRARRRPVVFWSFDREEVIQALKITSVFRPSLARLTARNISGDAANTEVLTEHKAPGFLTTIVPYKGDKSGVFLTQPSSRDGGSRPTTAPA